MKTKTTCPDCGTAVGQPHVSECDMERCSSCGWQRILCDCKDHDPRTSAWNGEWPEFVLNDDQIARQDHVDNAIHALLEELAGKEMAWDISLAGAVRDVISQEFHDRGIMTEMEFYPYMEEPSSTVAPPTSAGKHLGRGEGF
jgi:hypothetical protein